MTTYTLYLNRQCKTVEVEGLKVLKEAGEGGLFTVTHGVSGR